jgi:tetratricopeptide (TPR) repeat protein
VVLGAAGVAAADDVVISEEAKGHFRAGVDYLELPTGPRYEDAYRAFKAAYRISPSPKILGNLGLCAMMLERDGEAIEAYRRYLAEVGDIAPDERAGIARELERLEQSVVTLTLTVTPPGAVLIDERIPVNGSAVVNRYGPSDGDGRIVIGLRAGHHRVRLERDGHVTERFEIDAEPGTSVTRTVALARVSAAPSPEPVEEPSEAALPSMTMAPAVIAGLAITGALAVTTAVLAGVAGANHGDYEDARERGDLAAAAELSRRGESLNIAADVLLGAALASAAVTVVLWAVGGDREAPATALAWRF